MCVHVRARASARAYACVCVRVRERESPVRCATATKIAHTAAIIVWGHPEPARASVLAHMQCVFMT